MTAHRGAFVLCLLTAVGIVAAGDGRRITVRAEPERLTWSIFRSSDHLSGSEDAHIAAEMSFPQPLRTENDDGRYQLPSFTITVAPQPTRTVVRPSVGASAFLLQHEQGHYDLVVLAARALARELEGVTAPSAGELSHIVEDCVSKHTARSERLSEAYDRDTDHSRDRRQQARWNDVIRAVLRDPTPTEIAGLPL